MRANSASTLGSPVRFIGFLNLNRTDASTAQVESSAGNLILPHRMADHRIDIDAVKYPVQLLGRQRDDRLLGGGHRNLSSVSRFRTSTKPDRSKNSNFNRSQRRLQNAKTAGANGSSAIVSWTRTARLLMPARKSIGSRCR